MQSARGNILKKIREALTVPTPLPFPKSEGQSSVFQPLEQDIEVEFAERFTAIQGKFAFCFDENDFIKQFSQLAIDQGWKSVYCVDSKISSLFRDSSGFLNDWESLATCNVAITGCECIVARTGSIVMSAAEQSGRNTSVYAPVHVCLAYTSQLVYDVKDALEGIRGKYGSGLPSLITFATGPSRTADIEKTLVVGVHGPKEVYVFLVDDKT